MRYLIDFIKKDLESPPMIFIAGPRQVGKTTLSGHFIPSEYDQVENYPGYLNWDIRDHRRTILSGAVPAVKILIFDEIHKYPDWRNYLKGIYDQYKNTKRIIVTGSAKLDIYNHGGDSLQGRYVLYRLHPLGLDDSSEIILQDLLHWGGFPEPFFKKDKIFWSRWQNLRAKRVLEEDLIYLEQVKDITKVQLLMDLLPSKIGSPLSLNSLRGDLQCSHDAVSNWCKILENLYYIFTVPPYAQMEIQSLKKEAKVYLWDWSIIDDPGSRLENFVASMLWKYCQLQEDAYGNSLKLHFFQSKSKKEIDFLITKKQKPIMGIECKSQSLTLSPSLKSLREHFQNIPFFQTHMGREHLEFREYNTQIIPLEKFLRNLFSNKY